MCIVDQVKKIVTYICEAFEDWDLDDPVGKDIWKIIPNFWCIQEGIQEFEENWNFSP